MKLTKKLIALAMTAAMAAAMAGCGGGTDTADVETLLNTANETMANVDSMSAQMDMVMDMEVEGETFTMTTTSNIESIMDPMKMKMDMSLRMADEVMQENTMYAVAEGDTVTSYMNLDGTWYTQPMTVGDLSQYNAQQNMELYLQNLRSFSATGTEEINGTATTVIEGVLTGDSMREAMLSSGLQTATATMGVTEEDLDTMLEGISDMPVKLWISEDGYVMQYELDMTAMMQSMMSAMAEGVSMNISNVSVKMTCDNYNAVEDFEIPAEALAA